MIEDKSTNFTEEQLRAIKSDAKNVLIVATCGSGKLLHETTGMIRVNGKIDLAKNIKVGDYIFGRDGKPTEVIGKHSSKIKNVYKITFSDGKSVICDGRHFWQYQTINLRKQKKWDVKDTDYIFNNLELKLRYKTKNSKYINKANIYIPMADPLYFEKKEVPLNPWLLGVLLGGGTLDVERLSFFNKENDIVKRVSNIIRTYDCELNKIMGNDFEILGFNIKNILKRLNLLNNCSNNEFVPDCYKYNSEEIRLAVLQGLFDIDGRVLNNTNEYVTPSKRLADDVEWLAESLGMTVVKELLKKKLTFTYKGKKRVRQSAYRLYIKCTEKYPQCYSSEKHINKYKKPQSWARRSIESIEKLENFEGKFYCFEVDNEEHLYLLEHCIPTHNTTTLIGKLENLIENGIKPERIMVCTFTRKAAGEMKVRLERKLFSMNVEFESIHKLWISTIHSICGRIIRKYCMLLGYSQNFTIADEIKKLRIIKDISRKHISFVGEEKKLMGLISKYKNLNMNDKKVANSFYVNIDPEEFLDIVKEYDRQLKASDSMDFDDMLIHANTLLDKPGVLQDTQEMFDVVMVDECQDLNYPQYQFFLKLTKAPHIKLIMVGDDDQCIYEFRGSNINYILNHHKNVENCEIHYLSENFRCPVNIVNFSEQIVLQTKGRKEKSLKSNIKVDHPIYFDYYQSKEQEADNVVGRIEDLKSDGEDYNGIAILTRVGAQHRALEEAMVNASIPYKVVGGFSFYNRKEIKDSLAVIKLLTGDKHRDHLSRLINIPSRGVGDTTVAKLNAIDLPLWDVLVNYKSYDIIKGKAKTGIEEFLELVKKYTVIDKRDPFEISSKVIKYLEDIQYISKEFKNDSEEMKVQRWENVLELLKGFETFLNKDKSLTLEDYYDFVLEMSEVQEDRNGVTIMTMHASKGLEFRNVFITGVQDGFIPHFYSNTNQELDAERRLFYVAITRTKNRLFLSCFMDVPTACPTSFFKTFHWEKYMQVNDHGFDNGFKYYGKKKETALDW